MAQQWFYSKGDQKIGPVSSTELQSLAKSGKLSPNDFVWKEGVPSGLPANKVKGLFPDAPLAMPLSPMHGNETSAQVIRKSLPATQSISHVVDKVIPDTDDPKSQIASLKKKWEKLSRKAKIAVVAGSGLFCILLLCCCGLLVPSNGRSGIVLIAEKGKRGYIDINGKQIIDIKYDLAYEFSDGLAAVQTKGTWGYIDKTGKYIIQPVYEDASTFSEGLAGVKLKGKYCCIDIKGNKVFDCDYRIGEFADGVAPITVAAPLPDSPYRHLNGLVNKTGRVIVAPKFTLMSRFSSKRAIVQISEGNHDSSGIIDESGKYVVEPTRELHFGYQGGGQDFGYSEGIVGYTDNRLMLSGLVDTNGKQIVSASTLRCDPFSLTSFSQGLARVQPGISIKAAEGNEPVPMNHGKVGYIDNSGTYILTPQFADGRAFVEGLAPVQLNLNGKWGYIDKTGKMIIEPAYDDAREYSEERAIVQKADRYGVIDKTGQIIVDFRYKYISSFKNGIAVVGLP